MQNSGGFGGSRSEFLPGEGYDDSDIKYQRYGGCFVSHKKGLVYVLLTVCAVIVASGLVYFYAPRFKDRQYYGVVTDTDTEELIDLLTAPPILPHIDKKRQDLQNIIRPTHYKLYIQPYLDNEKDKNFTFEGNVTIDFYVQKSTKIIILNTRKLKITSPVIVLRTNSSRKHELKTESVVHRFLRVRRKREDTPPKPEENNAGEVKTEPGSETKLAEEKQLEEKKEETKIEEKVKDEKPVENIPPQEKPIDRKLEETPKEEKSAEEKQKEEKTTEEKQKEEKPSEDKQKEEKPLEDKPKEEKPLEDKQKEEKPLEDKPKEEKTPEEKQKEEKLLEGKTIEDKQEKLTDKNPMEENNKQPVETKIEETKPTELKINEAKSEIKTNTVEQKPDNSEKVLETSSKPENIPGNVEGKETKPDKIENTTVKSVSISTTPKPPPAIEVHSKEIVIGAKKQRMDPYNEYFQVELETSLKEGNNYSLQIQFHGSLKDNEGLARTRYLDDKGKISWNAISKFYPNFARYVFPCFDEPHYKSTFQINVGRRTNKMSLSNMPIKESIPDLTNNGWIWDEFEKTPKLSTQSAAFVVYDLVSKKIPGEPGVVINMWGRQPVLDAATYTLDVFPKLLNYYNQLFGYHYPLSKIDLIAVPNFYTDVSENFGLLSFEENIVVVNADSPNIDKETVLKNIAHGFSKQWFGNIVTVKNEDKVWFLEGISMYMQYLGIDSIEPIWKKTNDLLLLTQEVLNSDIDVQLSNYRFDSSDAENQNIYRKKACSIIRMLNNTLTEKVFIDHIKKIIEAWKYDAVVSEYFSKEFIKTIENERIPKDIDTDTVILNWANQYGYPIVTVERDESKNILLKQSSSNGKEQMWIIPLNYMNSNKETGVIWLKQSTLKIENIKELSTDKWVLFNIDQTTPCRVNYDSKNWELIIAQLQENPDVIPPLTRAQIIDDAFYFAKVGSLNYDLVLNLTSYMAEKERHHIPWKVFMKHIEEFDIILSRTSNYGYFQDYVLNILNKIYSEYVSKEDGPYEISELRNLIMNWACKLNFKTCKDWMYAKYQTWANFTTPEVTNPVDFGLRSTMYCTGVENRGKSAWDFLWKIFKANNVKDSDKKALMNGMGCAQSTWLLVRYFEMTLNKTQMSTKQVASAWNSFSTNSAKREAFDFIQENWNRLLKKYLDEEEVMRGIIIGYLSKLSSKRELDQVTKIYFDNKEELKAYTNYLAHAAKKIQSRLNWKLKHMDTFIDIIKTSL